MDQLRNYRDQIDQIDRQIQELFLRRMEIVASIAEYKMANEMTVYDANREEEVIRKNVDRIAMSRFAPYYRRVLECIMRESKEFQKDIVFGSAL